MLRLPPGRRTLLAKGAPPGSEAQSWMEDARVVNVFKFWSPAFQKSVVGH